MPFVFNPFTKKLGPVGTTSITPGTLVELTGNTGGAVGPDVSGNINVIGSGGITVTGNAGTNTLTISEGLGLIQTVTITLTSAEIKNLATTPKTLVAAQGANTLIAAYGFQAQYVYGGTSAFTNLISLELDYYDGASLFFINDFPSSTFLNQTATTFFIGGSGLNGFNFLTSQCVNLPVVLGNPNTNITGNAANDNSLIIYLQYVIISV